MSGALAVVLFVLGACTAAPPEILQTRHDMRYVEDRSADETYEQLSFFVRAQDSDGFEDITTLYLVHDQSELSWEFSPEEWDQVRLGEERWIGSDGVRMQGFAELPRGSYRIIVNDQAGEQAETTVSVNYSLLSAVRPDFPSLKIRDRSVVLESSQERNRVEVRDNRGSLVRALQHEPGVITASELGGGTDSRNGEEGHAGLPSLVDLYVFAPGPDDTILISGPYRL